MVNENEVKPKKKIPKWFWSVTGIFLVIIITAIAINSGEKREIKLETTFQQQQQEIPVFRQQEQRIKVQSREYTIVKEEDLSIKALDKPLSAYSSKEIAQLPMNIRMEYRIVVPSDITKEELKATLVQIVKDKTAENRDIDAIVVFVYDRKQDIDDAYTFGKVEWVPNGNWAGVTSAIASSNDRSSYRYVFDVKEKVGEQEGKPTEKEFEIYNVYWKKLNEPDNPRGYENHPLNDENANSWEKEKINEVAELYGITRQEIYDIATKVTFWKWK